VGREILDLAEWKAAGGFSLAGTTKYFCHERLDKCIEKEIEKSYMPLMIQLSSVLVISRA